MTKYLFGDLSPEAQKIAIENHRSKILENWNEFLIIEWKEKLEELGYEDVEINYSGFGSQGDGASFTYSGVDLKNEKAQIWVFSNVSIDKNQLINRIEISGTRNNSRYYHENSITNNLDIDFSGFKMMQENKDSIEIQIQKNADLMQYEVSKKIYNALESEYYIISSDENVIGELENESFEGGDLWFDEDGNEYVTRISDDIDDSNTEDFDIPDLDINERTPAFTNSLKEPEDLVGRKIQLSPMGEDFTIFEEFIQITDVEYDGFMEIEIQFLVVGKNDYEYFLLEKDEFEFFIENNQIDDINILNSTYQLTLVDNI